MIYIKSTVCIPIRTDRWVPLVLDTACFGAHLVWYQPYWILDKNIRFRVIILLRDFKLNFLVFNIICSSRILGNWLRKDSWTLLQGFSSYSCTLLQGFSTFWVFHQAIKPHTKQVLKTFENSQRFAPLMYFFLLEQSTVCFN